MRILKTLILLLALAFVGNAHAQSVLSVNIHRSTLHWTWTQGAPPNDGTPTEFLMKCGQASGNYTKITPVPYPTTEISVLSAIAGNGNWFCVVTAKNDFGESAASNEIPFVAGAAPSAPSDLQVQVQ